MVALRMSQGFQLPTAYQGEGLTKGGDEYNDIEKARVVRQDGDIHPNGKWVWVSSAAGGKGDWRVIKKQKDGTSNAPASEKTEKKEDKPSQEEVNQEMMKKTTSLNDFERKLRMLDNKTLFEVKDLLERIIESKATTKKEKEQAERSMKRVDKVMEENKETDGEKSKSGSADVTKEKESGEKKEKERQYFDYGNKTLYLPDLENQTLTSLLHSALMGINHAKREISLGVGKIKLKRLNETLEKERGKFSQLKEEADRRGLKFDYKEKEYENGKEKKETKAEDKPADKKDVRDLDGDKIPEGFTYFKGKESVYNWFLLRAGEAWQADLGAGDQVIVAYMPTEIQKQKSWPDDYAFFSADGNYATIRRRNGKDEFEFFLEKEDALEAAQKLIKQSDGSAKSSQGDQGDEDDDEGYAVDLPEGFEHYDKYSARKNYAGLECEELWTNEDEDNEIIVARMTDAQKKETWPDEDFSGTGKFVVMYDGDVIDFYDHKDDAFDEAEKLSEDDDDDD